MSIEAGFRRHNEIQNTDTDMMIEEGKNNTRSDSRMESEESFKRITRAASKKIMVGLTDSTKTRTQVIIRGENELKPVESFKKSDQMFIRKNSRTQKVRMKILR